LVLELYRIVYCTTFLRLIFSVDSTSIEETNVTKMTKVILLIISSFLLFEITTCETLTNMVNCSTQFSNLCLSKEYDITEPAMKPLTVKAKIVLEVSKKLDLSGSM
jgi:hypothetical protein